MDVAGMKFISLSPAITEIIYAVGAEEGLAANTRHCDFPPKARAKNRIEIWEQPSVEMARKFGAQTIFTDQIVPDGITKKCGKAGVNVMVLRPTTLEEVFQGIIAVGRETGREVESEKVVDEMKKEFAEIEAKTMRQRPRVYVEEGGKPPVFAGYWVPKLVEIAGGTCGLVKEGQKPRDVSRKELFDYNPEVMVVAWRGVGKNADLKVVEDRHWEGLSAIAGRHLFVLDDSLLLRPVPRLVEGARQLAEAIAEAADAAQEEGEDESWFYGEEEGGRASI